MTMSVNKQTALSAGAALLLWAAVPLALGQSHDAQPLPDAPALPLLAQADAGPGKMSAGSPVGMGAASGATATQPEQSGQGSAANPRLTRAQAEQMAIKSNPRVTMGQLMAKAQHQVVREARSAELPTISASITAVDAEDASRISAGSVTASRLFEHAGAGATLSQLITDFGRTRNLVASQKLLERAQNANALATTEDVVMATDQAFYSALEAQAMLKVAQQNVETRRTTDKQVNQMTANKLKSTLDLSFADVNLSQSKLLLLDAQNNADSTMAGLDAVLGLDHSVTFDLEEVTVMAPAPPADVNQLVQSALVQRPDLEALNYNQQAAVKQAHAQHDQMLPSISALGTAGSVPIRPPQYYTANWWGGIGVNMNIPIFNGVLYSAQSKEASIRAQAVSEQSRDLRDRIVRDVRTSWLAANAAYQRMAVTADLLKQADLALNLAETRYKLGLSSIVELSQAQYQQTDAAMGNTNAQYQYRLALANLNYEMGVAP